MLLAGEAGIGKSRLVAAFTEQCPRRKYTFALGRCVEYLRAPYAPIAQALDSFDTATADLLRSPSDDRHAKSALFAAVLDSLRKAADKRNTIVVFEDIHWADDGTIELLDYAARTMAMMRRLLIVATFRGDNSHDAKLAEIARNETAARIDLQGLGDGPMRDLVRTHLPTASASREESIVGLAAGNPFFAEELCSSTGDGSIPQSLRAAVEQRLTILGADEVRALSCSAIFSDAAELDVLAAVLDTSPRDVVHLLEPAQRVGLLVEDSGGFGFRHALTRHIIAGRLLASERLTFHERAANYFESLIERDDPSHVARLAYHFSKAHAPLKAYTYNLQAAASAYSVHAYTDAARFYEQAAYFASARSAQRAEALRSAGDAHFRAGEPHRAQEAYRKGLRLYRSMGRWDDAADVYLHMVRSSYNSGKSDDAIAVAREALLELPLMSENRQSWIRTNVGFYLSNCGKPQEALAQLAQVREATLEGSGENLIHHAAKSGSFAAIGDTATWLSHLAGSTQAAESVDGAPRIAHYGGIATDAMFLGEAVIAEEYFDKALALCRKLRLQVYEAIFASHAAFERWLQGDLDGAGALLETARTVKADVPALWAYTALVSLLLRRTKTIDSATIDRALETGQPAIFGPLIGWYARHLVSERAGAAATALLERALACIVHAYPAWDVGIAAAEFGTQRDAARARELFAGFAGAASHVHRASAALVDAHYERRFGSQTLAVARAAEAQREFAAVHWNHYVLLAAPAVEFPAADHAPSVRLSERERQVGELLLEGCTNRKIAQRLTISEKTAEKHVAALFKALGASSRSQAAVLLAKMSTQARD